MIRASAVSLLSVALVVVPAPALRLRSAPIWPGPARSTTSGSSTARSRRRPLAQKTPATADSATVVLARAHLERYRERANPDDLSAARVALGTVRVSNLDTRDHVDFLMALGEALFFEDDYGAAATLFESGIDRAIAQGTETGEAMLEWWGSAVERHADGARARRPRQRVQALARADERASCREIPDRPRPRTSSSSATRGSGEPIEAWNAAIAGWVRARMAGARSASCAPISTSSCSKASFPIAFNRWPPTGAPRPNRTLRAEWAL